jgi:hypothetical protein
MLIVSMRAGKDASQDRRFHRGIGERSNSIMERHNGSEERTQGRKEGRTQGREEGRTQEHREEGRKKGGQEASLAVGQ